MRFAGSTRKGKVVGKKLLLFGVTTTFLSLALNFYLSYSFNKLYSMHKEFLMDEGTSNTYTLNISEGDVALVTYNVSINSGRETTVSLELLNADGYTLDSRRSIISRKGGLTGQLNIDNSLDRLVITIENEGWTSARCEVNLTYTRSPLIYNLASIVSAFIGISGAVIASFGVLEYLISKTRREETQN